MTQCTYLHTSSKGDFKKKQTNKKQQINNITNLSLANTKGVFIRMVQDDATFTTHKNKQQLNRHTTKMNLLLHRNNEVDETPHLRLTILCTSISIHTHIHTYKIHYQQRKTRPQIYHLGILIFGFLYYTSLALAGHIHTIDLL